MRSTLRGAAVAPATVPAGTAGAIEFSFFTNVPITYNTSFVLGFPRTTDSGQSIGSAHGFKIPLGDARAFITAAFAPGFAYGSSSPYSTSIVVQNLGGLGTGSRGILPGEKVKLTVANVSYPRYYGRTGAFTISVLSSDFPAGHARAAGVVLDNHGPPVFASGRIEVEFPEMLPAEPDAVLVTQLVAADPDGLASAPTQYAIVSGNEAGLFSLNATTGVIRTRARIDYEALADPRLALVVRATDGSPPHDSTTATLVVVVTDRNDNAPAFTYPNAARRAYYLAIAHEDQAAVGRSILVANATDRDAGANGRVTYTLGAGAGADRFAIGAATGDITIAKPVNSYEHYSLLLPVIATDSAEAASQRRSTSAWAVVGIINDSDLNFMLLAPNGAFDRTFFENAVADALCPEGTCAVIVYNTSQAAGGAGAAARRGRRASNTKVAFVVLEITDPGYPKFKLVANTTGKLASPAVARALGAHTSKFVLLSAGDAATTTAAASPADDEDFGGLSLLELIWVCVAGCLFLGCCLTLFLYCCCGCCGGGAGSKQKQLHLVPAPNPHQDVWQMPPGSLPSHYYDVSPHPVQGFDFHVGRTAPGSGGAAGMQHGVPFDVPQHSAHYFPPDNDWAVAEQMLQNHGSPGSPPLQRPPTPMQVPLPRAYGQPLDWADTGSALLSAAGTQLHHQVDYARLDFDKTGQYRLPDNRLSPPRGPIMAPSPPQPVFDDPHGPPPPRAYIPPLGAFAAPARRQSAASGLYSIDPNAILLEAEADYLGAMGQTLNNPLSGDPLWAEMAREDGRFWGLDVAGLPPGPLPGPQGQGLKRASVHDDEYIGILDQNVNAPHVVARQQPHTRPGPIF